MTPEDELRLSFYEEVAPLNSRHGIDLVRHTGTDRIFVRKKLQHYDREVYDILRESKFSGIPVIEELIEQGDTLILIEEYISGSTLEQTLQEHGCFTEEETIPIILSLCEVLRPLHAHDPEIIHRDIKTTNLILRDDGTLYLIDFDASKMFDPAKNRDTVLIGTEDYAAPEQYGFAQSDRRTDIYAIGVLMCKMLTGKTLSEADYAGALAPIIQLCTQMDPKGRFNTVDALSYALKQLINTPTMPAQKQSSETHSDDQSVRHPIYKNIPGFGSGKVLPAVAAVIWYLVIIYNLIFTKNYDSKGNLMTGLEHWMRNIYFAAVCFFETFYLGNAFDWRDRFPFKTWKDKPLFFKVTRIVIGAVLIFGACLIVTSALLALLD